MKKMRVVMLVAVAVALLGGAMWLYIRLPVLVTAPASAEQVILLHGLGRGETAMILLENRLAKAGFEVHNIGYPSLDEPPETLLRLVAGEIEACCANNGRSVHFVGHSLGGLIARAYLADRPLQNLGRVVLLGTPNKGSELVDEFADLWLFQVLAGPTAAALGTDQASLPNRLGPPYYPLGIIAGSQGNPLSSEFLPGQHDGMVTLESARLKGMTDFRVFDTNHAMMRYEAAVAQEVIHFLRHGRFSEP